MVNLLLFTGPLGSVTVAVKLPDKAGQLNFIITDPPDPA